MELTELDDYCTKSKNPVICRELFLAAMNYLHQDNLEIKIYQEKALLNHLAEMVKRDVIHEQIEVGDKTIFNELSKESLVKAKAIVDKLDHVSSDEVYLLAVHFEAVHFQ